MTREQIPINPQVLAWARSRAGYSAAEARSVFSQIESWEAGESAPTYKQLETLSEKFKIPVAVFFFPEPPEIEPIRNSFRTLPDQQFALIPRQVTAMLRKAKALQLNLDELHDGRTSKQRLIVKELTFEANITAQEMADAVRRYLNISVAKQTSWNNPDEALEQWRQSLNDVGIYVFKDAFKNTDYSGFCLYDDDFPIIYINNSNTKTRQIFTLFHELAHLLFRTSGIDMFSDDYIESLQGSDKKIEILCNLFAASFLVPEDEFSQFIQDKNVNDETVELAAEHFNVSREVIYRRFLDQNLVTRSDYLTKAREWAEQRNSSTGRSGGGNYYYTQIAYLGSQYINLALQQYHRNRFDDVKLAEYLNIKPKNVEKFQEKFLSREA